MERRMMETRLVRLICPLLVAFNACTAAIGVGAAASSLDVRLLDFVSEDLKSGSMDAAMNGASFIGSKEVGAAFCIGMLLLGDEGGKRTGKLASASLLATSVVVGLTRYAVDRTRPDSINNSRWNSSFPSGHAAGSFAVATIIARRYPRLRYVAYSTAGVVALSRVYLRRHYPSDVIVGGVIGYATSRVTLAIQKRIF